MKRSVSETHRTVANEFTRDEGGAQKRLRAAVFGGIATERQDEIDAIAASSLELKLGDRVCLAWIRLSADNPGGAYPELDTNFQMLPQILELMPDRRVILVGDDPGDKVPKPEKNLIKFWGEPHKLNRAEQVYLLWRISQQFDTIAVGMESGALEMPALVGVKTIYLERAAMRAGKA